MITLRGLPLRRPVVVSRKAPHFPGRGGHSPLRLLVIRTNSRCTCQKVTTNHRGGTRALPPAMPAPPVADHLTIALSASGAQQDSTLRGSLADRAEEPGEEPVGNGTPRGLVHGAREEQVELRTPEQPGARRSGVADQLRHLATLDPHGQIDLLRRGQERHLPDLPEIHADGVGGDAGRLPGLGGKAGCTVGKRGEVLRRMSAKQVPILGTRPKEPGGLTESPCPRVNLNLRTPPSCSAGTLSRRE